MTYHILNGDSLAASFPGANIPGEIVVVREGLIEGDVAGGSLHEFWGARANFLGVTLDEYQRKVGSEIEKMLNAPDNSEFNLWFEYDLFCQVNMWFVISVIHNLSIRSTVYAAYASHVKKGDDHFWTGFGQATAVDLNLCHSRRRLLADADIELGDSLWRVYKAGNMGKLQKLSRAKSDAFPFIREVITAHIERFPKRGEKGRPERVLEDILKNKSTDFHEVCREFWKRESIYGFGDLQLRTLFDKVTGNPGMH